MMPTVGGGIYNNEGSITISGSTISGNSVWLHGGGIRNYDGSITITGSTISDNIAQDDGGGVYNERMYKDWSSLTISGSTISDNSADLGGGIYNCYNLITITGSTISNNSADYGGGIYLDHGGILVPLSAITIGGSSDAEKNTICGNYKSGEVLSLDQQIMDNSGSLYEIYKGTNYISVYCD